MGSRGASSGIAKNGKVYGTEYTTIKQVGNIKFVKTNEGATNAQLETMTNGRIYVTLNNKTDKPQYITFYNKGKKTKTIDINGRPHTINGIKLRTHVHIGEEHDNKGSRPLNKAELKFLAKVLKM